MIIHGKPYEVGEAKRRAVYRLTGEPTPEQRERIDKLEKGLHDGWASLGDPYSVMRQVEALGVELGEEVQTADGKWTSVPDPDVPLTTMTAGADFAN